MAFAINDRRIGPDEPPFIIAELSANHNGSLERAFEIIDAAQHCGADAIKLQTYSADTMTIDCDHEDFMIHGGLWHGYKLYDLYKWAETPYEWHKPLFDHARQRGVTVFSTPFDETAVDLLEDLNSPAYKISSFEVVDLPLIRYVASTGKPMIISTGMANAEEIQEALEAARGAGCTQIALLHCVSGYPAPAEDYNLRTIPDMIKRYGTVVGLSDHTLDNATAIASVALGASIIEKHVTLDRKGGGPDDSFSLEPIDLANLCRDAKTAWSALGKPDYERKASEQGNVKFRRSLYFVRDLGAGERIGAEDIRSVRPGFGLPPKHYESILGRELAESVSFGQPVRVEVLKGWIEKSTPSTKKPG